MSKGSQRSSVRKFAESYNIPIAHVGLADVQMKSHDISNYCGDVHETYSYVGKAVSKLGFGMLEVRVIIDVDQCTMGESRADSTVGNAFVVEAFEDERYNLNVRNLTGMVSNEFTGNLFYVLTVNGRGRIGEIGRFFTGTYYSIEDVIQALSDISESAWAHISTVMSDYEDEPINQNVSKFSDILSKMRQGKD